MGAAVVDWGTYLIQPMHPIVSIDVLLTIGSTGIQPHIANLVPSFRAVHPCLLKGSSGLYLYPTEITMPAG